MCLLCCCAVDEVANGLPDDGKMSLRPLAAGNTNQSQTGAIFEDHSYGFNAPVDREQALHGMQQLQKRICYCTDSTDCNPSRLINLGELTITGEEVTSWCQVAIRLFYFPYVSCGSMTALSIVHAVEPPRGVCADVWDTEFRVSVVQSIQLPFRPKKPLLQRDAQRELVVTRGRFSQQCVLVANADSCTISLMDFPNETWAWKKPGLLQYYDSSLPIDPVDTRPRPYVSIASVTPAGARLTP